MLGQRYHHVDAIHQAVAAPPPVHRQPRQRAEQVVVQDRQRAREPHQYLEPQFVVQTIDEFVKLIPFYEQYIFRKLRLQSYRNTKKSEQKMLNNFKRIFGSEKEVVICFGDYKQKQHMKFKEVR